MSIVLGIVIIVIALCSEAFFAGSETGMISINRIKLSYLVEKKDKRAMIIKAFLDNPERFLATTLVGVNLAVIISSSVASGLIVSNLDKAHYAALISTVMMLPLILIFGEIIPKAIFRQHADTLSLWAAYPLKVAQILLFPLVWIATQVASFASSATRGKKGKNNPYVTREEMRLLLGESAKHGYLTNEEIGMAYEIFDFGRTLARSVTVPIDNVVSAPLEASSDEVAELIALSGYSRIPIHKGTHENIIGTIQVSDLVTCSSETQDISGLIRAPYIVSEDRPIDELLKEFQTNRKNVAIVVDKKNRATGIVTLEDVIEEIVGTIEDEYDTGEAEAR